MAGQASSRDGWIRVALCDDAVSVAGQRAHFKGYACDAGDDGEDGVFVRWEWDGCRLRARACRTGFLPLYYYADEAQVALSTRIEDIFAATGRAPDLDTAALGLLLRLGFLVGDRTPFEGVKVLGPGGEFAWEPGKAPSVRSAYLQPDAAEGSAAGRGPAGRGPAGRGPAERGPAELRARYAALFRDAMASISGTLSDPFAVPLSGGRDSRHIALELHRMGRKPLFALTARHLAPRNNEDARVAGLLCDAMGWRHMLVDQPAGDAFERECEHARATDFQSFEHAWTLPLRDALARSDATEVFDGVGGDVLSAGLFQDEAHLALYRDGRIPELARALLEKWSILGGEAGLAPALGEGLAAVRDPGPATALLEAELLRHVGQPNPLKSFYFWNRSRRGTGLLPFKVFGGKVAYAPYLHAPLLRFLLGLAPEATRDRTLHTDTIRLADASIGAIAYEDKSAPADARRQNARAFHASVLACALRQRGMLNAAFLAPRAARAFVLGTAPHAAWWKPRRVAYLSGLARFVNPSRPPALARPPHTRTEQACC